MTGLAHARIEREFSETFSVNELAEHVKPAGAAVGLPVEIKSIPNPHTQIADPYYTPQHTGRPHPRRKPPHLPTAPPDPLLDRPMPAPDTRRRARGPPGAAG
mgnify:CR=1 FL=1